jgi:flagellar M-ring protein FliF
MWNRLSRPAQAGLAAGVLLILGAVAALGYWAYRTDYQVLFADLAPRDAAAMAAELDKAKTAYQLADGGKTILVPAAIVHKTRLQLMGGDVPLHGAVGFEVFNNADFGMTEFVQKVNYQRAIQGELTRTILSIDKVQAARVHLAIPEQGLFKKATAKAKASVTLTMKPGESMAPDQVAGIQRLVAAAVPDMVGADVTVLDQKGVALTRPNGGDGSVESAGTQLDAKRAAEDYLGKKVAQVLDRTFGAGQAVASVDVLLNMDQSKVTTEEVLAAKGGEAGASPTGVTVRERISNRDPVAGAKSGGEAATTSETDYQVGRRVEQVAVASGALRRMTIAVLVRQPLDDGQIDKMKEVVGLAVGFNSARGDAIVVYPMDKFVSAASSTVAAAPDGAADVQLSAPVASGVKVANPGISTLLVLAGLLIVACLGALWYWRATRVAVPARVRLDPQARAQLLGEVRSWIAAPADTLAVKAKP